MFRETNSFTPIQRLVRCQTFIAVFFCLLSFLGCPAMSCKQCLAKHCCVNMRKYNVIFSHWFVSVVLFVFRSHRVLSAVPWSSSNMASGYRGDIEDGALKSCQSKDCRDSNLFRSVGGPLFHQDSVFSNRSCSHCSGDHRVKVRKFRSFVSIIFFPCFQICFHPESIILSLWTCRKRCPWRVAFRQSPEAVWPVTQCDAEGHGSEWCEAKVRINESKQYEKWSSERERERDRFSMKQSI